MTKLKQQHRSRDGVLGLAALVVAIAALVVAVVGVAGAAPSRVIIRRGDIAPGAVTAKSIARGAVSAGKIRKSAVTAPKLAKASVTGLALAPQAVTAVAIAPGSVEGGMLASESVVMKPIADLDTVVGDKNWTPSNTEAALCGAGEALLGGGYAFTSTGDGEVASIEALPVLNGETKAMLGRITSNAGGAASAEVAAICLK